MSRVFFIEFVSLSKFLIRFISPLHWTSWCRMAFKLLVCTASLGVFSPQRSALKELLNDFKPTAVSYRLVSASSAPGISRGLLWIWTLRDHSIIHLTESSYYQNVPAVADPCPSGTLRRFFTGNRYFSQESNKRVALEGKYQTQSTWINNKGRSRSHLLNQWDCLLCGNYNYYSSLMSWTFSQPFGSLGHTLPLPYITFPHCFWWQHSRLPLYYCWGGLE